MDKGLVLVRAEDDPQGRVVAVSAFEVIKHPHVHIHLADILMRQFRGLEVDYHEALEQIVVEHQIYIDRYPCSGGLEYVCSSRS